MMNTNKQPELKIRQGEELAQHCRFGVGGLADFYCEVSNAMQLVQAVKYANENQLHYFIYGGGSNIFFDDAGFRGLIIRFAGGGFEIDTKRNTVTVSAGVELPALVRELATHDIGGLEFLGNIPGSVGGAIVGNAGCYGKSIADVLMFVDVLDTKTLDVSRVEPGFLGFDYRHSRLKQDASILVVGATMQVEKRSGKAILAKLETELADRMEKHPHDAKCAGSFFKNESRTNPAWKLVTDAGMANASAGQASISSRHANFLVNSGNATSSDIIALVRKIQAAVKQHCGFELVPEARYVSPTGVREIGGC